MIHTIDDIVSLVKAGETDWKKHGNVTVSLQSGILIFNYNFDAEMEAIWTPFERLSRGLLIKEGTGEIVARSYDKFFNWGQHGETTEATLKCIFEKADGSMGMNYRLSSNDMRVCTRGSLNSDQALWATNFWKAHYSDITLPEEMTLIFEIIYPENRIVVDYEGWSGFIVHGARNRHTGEFFPLEAVEQLLESKGMLSPTRMRMVERYKFDSTDDIRDWVDSFDFNFEGVVAEFEDGFRSKFKGKEYLKVHRLISGITPKRIHELAMSGDDEVQKARASLPDEFLDQFDEIYALINTRTDEVVYSAESTFELIQSKFDNRKDVALYIFKSGEVDKAISSYIFNLMDGNPIRDIVLKDYFKINGK